MERNLIYNQAPKSLCLNEEFEPNSVVIKQVRFQQKCTCNITNLLAQALDIDKPTLQVIGLIKIYYIYSTSIDYVCLQKFHLDKTFFKFSYVFLQPYFPLLLSLYF